MMNDDTNKGFNREVRTFIYNRTPNIFVDFRFVAETTRMYVHLPCRNDCVGFCCCMGWRFVTGR